MSDGWETRRLSTPNFVVDPRTVALNSGRQIDWSYVPDTYRTGGSASAIVKANGAAAAAATSITVDALPVDLAIGTMLHFGGSGEFAKLTAPAVAGATSITVEALPNGIEDNDEATVAGTGSKTIKGGTVMAELTGGKLVPRANRPGSETATCLLATPAVQGDRSEASTGYGCIVGGVIYENMLPEADSGTGLINSTYKTELQAAGVGTGFAWEQYSDNMA